MSKAYLTIDDSPSKATKPLVDALDERGIQAIFFCRGDNMEAHMDEVIYAIKHGHIIGNHSYAHQHGGDISFETWVTDTEKTEGLIHQAYEAAGVHRPTKYYRFPYLDRGNGDPIEQHWPKIIASIAAGEDYDLDVNEEVLRRQSYLKDHSFTQPFADLNHPIYTRTPAIAGSVDMLLTYSTQDWLRHQRHLDKGTSLEDLKAMMSADPFINGAEGYEHIFLIHDHQDIHDVSLALVDHMLALGIVFPTLDL